MSEVLKKVPTDEVVETLYNDLRRRIGDIEPNDAMVAPDYADLTLPILVGTRCTHNRGLYKCNTQINSSEAWTAAHWDEITVGSELDSLQSDVSGKTDQGAVATPYGSLTWPVTAGQYCFQNGYVYRAKQDIATSESWTAAHWDQVVLGDEVCRAMNAIQGVDDFLGDTDTDLGTHSVVTETDLTNMTASTATVQSVKFVITKYTISASGTASANAIRNAQDIELPAGYYCLSLDHPITNAGYQVQLFDVDGNTAIKSFTSAQTVFDYYFTLEATKNVRIRAYAANGSVIDQLHTVTLKKISKQTYENDVAYFLIGLGDTKQVFYTDIEQGSIDGTAGQPITGPTRCRTKEFISIDDFVMCDLTQKKNYDLYIFLYDESKGFIQRIPGAWSNAIYTKSDIVGSYATAKYIKVIFRRHNDSSIEQTDIAEMQGVITVIYRESSIESFDGFRSESIRSRFDDQFNYIAYSHLLSGDAPANTAEHFLHCAKQDFTALKGDVRNTVDRGLIMCHDPGYTFDGNDKIIAYNSSNKTLINTLTVAQCKALTFADQYDGQDCHPTDFDTFVKICKKYGKIAFVTVRDEAIDTVVAPYVIATLKKYRMMDRAIINSFTMATLTKFRKFDSNIMLSLVMDQNTPPSISKVDAVMTLGNCILNLFDVPLPSGATLDNVLTEYEPVLQYAINNNVMIYEAQTTNAQTDTLLAHGITGSHMTEIPDYMN